MKNHYAKDLRTSKYRPKVVEDKRRKVKDVKDLTYQELVDLINQEKDDE